MRRISQPNEPPALGSPAACVLPLILVLAGCMATDDAMVGQRFRDCPDCPEMVVLPSGTFKMGTLEAAGCGDGDPWGVSSAQTDWWSSPIWYCNEWPVHSVSVPPFAVGVYEVTFAEWDACTAAGGCGGYRPSDEGWGRGRRPVVNVSWDDAELYVKWLSVRTGRRYRLLSESEWEYAARAGTTTPFHTGATISMYQANYNGRNIYYDGRDIYGGGDWGAYRQRTIPVGSFPANGFGLHDMHANVYEWVQDCWNDSYRGAPRYGRAWESGDCLRRVLRGGAWGKPPSSLRSAYRIRFSTAGRSSDVGFRVARKFTP